MAVGLSQTVVAQDDDEEDKPPVYDYEDKPPSNPPKSIHLIQLRLNGGVPNPLTSQVMRKAFIGIYEANLSVNFRLGNYGYVGAGFKNALFSVSNHTRFSNHTKLQTNSAYLRVGYDKYVNGSVFSSYYLNVGYTQGFYTAVDAKAKAAGNLNMSAAFLQPTYSINFFAEERMTLGFYAGYHYMMWRFDPYQIDLESTDPNFNKYKSSANASYWIIGLEMYIGLGKRK